MSIQNKALKRRIIEISYKKKLSHLGSCLSAVDIIDEVYLNKGPDDLFILSSGHAGLALYCVLEKYGGRNAEEIFDHHGVHPDRCDSCGLLVSAGSLGHGLGIGVGLALATRSRGVHCLVSDGECSEGSIWEALRVAKEQNLDNLSVYVNHNNYGAYKAIDNQDLIVKLNTYAPNLINHYQTTWDYLPFLKGQLAHYKVMNWQEYKQAMEILA